MQNENHGSGESGTSNDAQEIEDDWREKILAETVPRQTNVQPIKTPISKAPVAVHEPSSVPESPSVKRAPEHSTAPARQRRQRTRPKHLEDYVCV